MTELLPHILVVEDEPAVRRFLRVSLEGEPYRVSEASSGEEALREAVHQLPDVVLLDLGLPDIDGLEVTRRLREWSAVPIIVLSARGQEADKVAALDQGADDYLTKPFGVPELLARIRVALRREARARPASADSVFRAQGLEVDLLARRVFVEGQEVHLTPLEYQLLTALVRNAGRVMTHRQLLRAVWGPAYGQEVHYVRVYMAQLRRKIEADPARPRYLLTEQGVGYRLAAQGEPIS